MITWLLYPILEAFIQYVWIEKLKRRPQYEYLRMMRGLMFFVWGIWMIYRIEVYWDAQSWDSFWICMSLFCWAPTTFFLIFNPLLNKLRGRELDYRGKDSGPFDKLSPQNYRRLMVGCAVVALVSLVVALKWFPII